MNEFRTANGELMSKFLEIFYNVIQSNLLSFEKLQSVGPSSSTLNKPPIHQSTNRQLLPATFNLSAGIRIIF